MKRYSAEPFACNSETDSVLVTTTNYNLCICKNSVGWVQALDGYTTCAWDTWIVANGAGRRWVNGTYATSCKGYRSPVAPYAYTGLTGNGVYTIDPDGADSGTPYNVYCDMTTNGGGWTVVYGSAGADGEYGISSDTETTANSPLSFLFHNLNRAKKVAISNLSTESIIVRTNSDFLKWDKAMFTNALQSPNSTQFLTATCSTGAGVSTACKAGWSNYNSSSGGDFGVTSGSFDYHASNYFMLNSSCVNMLFYSYSAASADGDQGYDVNTSLSGWSSTSGCNGAEGGHMSFYAGMR